MHVTVASVIYLKALNYLKDFLKSLEVQSYSEFDVILINDNIPADIINEELHKLDYRILNRISIVDKNSEKLQPYELRIELLNEALKRNVELLILMDCDDMAMNNRISELYHQYDDNYTFFYNELLDIKGNKIMQELPQKTENVDLILECNYLGLSNCAINMNQISREFVDSLYEGRTEIFDWYLFSRILLNGGKGKRINGTATLYRLYDNNIAGIPKNTKKDLEKEKKIKIEHYQLLKKYDSRYLELINKYENMDIVLKQDSASHNKLGYWWDMLM